MSLLVKQHFRLPCLGRPRMCALVHGLWLPMEEDHHIFQEVQEPHAGGWDEDIQTIDFDYLRLCDDGIPTLFTPPTVWTPGHDHPTGSLQATPRSAASSGAWLGSRRQLFSPLSKSTLRSSPQPLSMRAEFSEEKVRSGITGLPSLRFDEEFNLGGENEEGHDADGVNEQLQFGQTGAFPEELGEEMETHGTVIGGVDLHYNRLPNIPPAGTILSASRDDSPCFTPNKRQRVIPTSTASSTPVIDRVPIKTSDLRVVHMFASFLAHKLVAQKGPEAFQQQGAAPIPLIPSHASLLAVLDV